MLISTKNLRKFILLFIYKKALFKYNVYHNELGGDMLKKIISFLFLALILTACGSSSTTNSEEISFDILHEGDFSSTVSNTARKIQSFSTETSYSDELNLYTNDDIKENLDFSEGRVLLVDYGQRTAGYEIDIESLSDKGDYLELSINLYSPGDNCFYATVMIHPYYFIYIPSNKMIIVKEEYKKYQACE